MILDYSFRKSFLISNPPLKPDQQPIQQLLPPQIPPSSLVRTYSFSQLKHNDSFKEQFNDSSIELPKNTKLIDEMEVKIQELKSQLKKQKEKRIKISQEHKQFDEKYQNLLKNIKEKQKDEAIKEQKRELVKKLAILHQQVLILKGQIAQKSEQLITYESRSEQSRRLLQKLNQNINKKESKLIKDKEIIIKELQETKKILEESRTKEQQTRKQLNVILSQIQKTKKDNQKQLALDFEGKVKLFTDQFQAKLVQKDHEIADLHDKMSKIELQCQKKIEEIKQCMSQEELNKFSNQNIIQQLREQIAAKDQSIQKLIQKNKELQNLAEIFQSKLEETENQSSDIRESQNSRNQKLEIQLANFSYEAKENEQKIIQLEEQNQRMNVMVNELKEDKKLLHREKEQLRSQLNQKGLQLESLRNKLEQIKENQIKYSSIIQNYEKEQQRFFDQQARQTESLTILQIKAKSNAIEIQKLNLKISEKQEQLNTVLKQLEKYKKMYKMQHQTLEMYKEETHLMREKTEQKWQELKVYYENEIALLQGRISNHESLNSNDSRLKIKSFLTNEKAKINSSRLSMNKSTPKALEKQDHSQLALKRKILYRTNDPDEELKENYWHGLNNDSLDHSDEPGSKN